MKLKMSLYKIYFKGLTYHVQGPVLDPTALLGKTMTRKECSCNLWT